MVAVHCTAICLDLPIPHCFVCLLFCIIATYKVGYRLLTALYSAPSLGHQAVSTMTWYPTQSHYPDTEPTSPCSILIMPSTLLGNLKYKLFSPWFVRPVFEPMRSESPDLPQGNIETSMDYWLEHPLPMWEVLDLLKLIGFLYKATFTRDLSDYETARIASFCVRIMWLSEILYCGCSSMVSHWRKYY